VKPVPLLLLVTVVALTGCNTLVTRRDLYSPKKGSGYWTRQAEHPNRRNPTNAAKPGPESGIVGISHPPYGVQRERELHRWPADESTGILGISRSHPQGARWLGTPSYNP
jgi:hypothetical protein